MSDIQEGYKRCSKCGEVKPISEFRLHKNYAGGHQTTCKMCERIHTKKWQASHKEEINHKFRIHYHENPKCQLDRVKKYYACVKHPSCPAVGGNGAKFVTLTCPICGEEFRRSKSRIDTDYQRRGTTKFYCSRECQFESMRKSHKSEYEKNITRIRKEQRL